MAPGIANTQASYNIGSSIYYDVRNAVCVDYIHKLNNTSV